MHQAVTSIKYATIEPLTSLWSNEYERFKEESEAEQTYSGYIRTQCVNRTNHPKSWFDFRSIGSTSAFYVRYLCTAVMCGRTGSSFPLKVGHQQTGKGGAFPKVRVLHQTGDLRLCSFQRTDSRPEFEQM